MAHLSSRVRDLIVSIPISIMEFRYLACLKRCFFQDANAGAPLATLFAQVALFAASLCLQETRLCSDYDHCGIKTAILYHICSVLLCYSNRWSGRGFFRRRCDVKVNSTADLICLFLGIHLDKLYEKSLASLCFALTITILFLILVVIIQPTTDLGFFGFLVGATVSVAYNLFQLKLGTWIVVAICFVLLAFKYWLDKNWLEIDVELKLDNYSMFVFRHLKVGDRYPALVIQSIDALMVAGFYLVWASAFLSTNCLNSESCGSCSAMEKLKCGAIYGLWLSPAHIHRVYYSLFQVEFWVLWPKTIPFTEGMVQTIAEMEYMRTFFKRVKEGPFPRPSHANEGRIIIYKARDTIDHRFGVSGVCPPKAMEKLPKWVRKRIENRIFKTRQDIEAFEKYIQDIAGKGN